MRKVESIYTKIKKIYHIGVDRINLDSAELDDTDVDAIIYFLQRYPVVTEINLSNNLFSTNGIIKLLEHNKSVTCINLRGINLDNTFETKLKQLIRDGKYYNPCRLILSPGRIDEIPIRNMTRRNYAAALSMFDAANLYVLYLAISEKYNLPLGFRKHLFMQYILNITLVNPVLFDDGIINPVRIKKCFALYSRKDLAEIKNHLFTYRGLYLNTQCVSHDNYLSDDYYRQYAALNGRDPRTQYYLTNPRFLQYRGDLFRFPEDKERFALLKQAAEMNHLEAQLTLGYYYSSEKDRKKAEYYFTLCAKQGCEEVLEVLKNRYNRSDIAAYGAAVSALKLGVSEKTISNCNYIINMHRFSIYSYPIIKQAKVLRCIAKLYDDVRDRWRGNCRRITREEDIDACKFYLNDIINEIRELPQGIGNEIFKSAFTKGSLFEKTILEKYDASNTYLNQIREILKSRGISALKPQAIRKISSDSVHESVSESASKLYNRYCSKIDGAGLEDIIKEIKIFISSLSSDSLEKKAAKQCIQTINDSDYTFTDKTSQVTTKQLLALTFLAINDNKNRIGDFVDARVQFIKALYEIQRGFNISESGIDLGGSDRHICRGGVFNKLIEKLAGKHPDCEIIYITKETATLKLFCVVEEEALLYLTQLSNSKNIKELLTFTQLINKVAEEGNSVIWDQIKDRIADRMFEEFGSLFEGRDDFNFIGLVDVGQCTMLADLSYFQQQIQKSPSYRQYCSQVMLSNAGIFATVEKQQRDTLSVTYQLTCKQTNRIASR